MVSAETAQQWYNEIQADIRFSAWIAEAEKTYELQMGPCNDSEWFSTVKGGKALIGMAETSRPLPSFAHEILHVCMSARGYRHILGSINADPNKNQLISALLSALDNELQHHRMFPEFVAAGFDCEDFYAESDDAGHVEVETQIKRLTSQIPPVYAVFSYFTLIAPGGRWPDGERERLTDLLKHQVGSATWAKLQAISEIFEGWKKQADLDPTDTIVSIFETLGGLDVTFIGEDLNKYPAGAFIPRSTDDGLFRKAIGF